MDIRQPIEISVSDEVDGVEVSPEAVPVDLLKDFATDVEAFLQGSEPKAPSRQIVSVHKGSLSLRQESVPSNRLAWDIQSLEASNDVSAIDPRRASVMLKWQKLAAKYPGRRYAVRDSERSHGFVVSANTSYYKSSPDLWVAVRRKLFGEVFNMGGASSPNIHVETLDGTKLIIDASHDVLAAEPGNRLYHSWLLSVTAEENVETGELRNIKFVSFEDYEPENRTDLVRKLEESGRVAWGDLDPVKWTREQRDD